MQYTLTEIWWYCFFLSDVNECWRYPGRLCAQTCENTPGSYECLCTSGFRLSGDGKNCEGMCALMSACMGVRECVHPCVRVGAGACMFLWICTWKYAWKCVCWCSRLVCVCEQYRFLDMLILKLATEQYIVKEGWQVKWLIYYTVHHTIRSSTNQ